MGTSWKDKKRELKEPDAFVKQGQSFLDRIVARRNILLPVIGGALLVAAGFYSVRWWMGKQMNDLWGEYYRVAKAEGDARIEALKAFYANGSKKRPVVQAAVDLGDHFFDKAKEASEESEKQAHAKRAVEWYSNALSGNLSPIEKQLLLVNRGKANEMIDQFDPALQDFKEASLIDGEGKALALLGQGWILELKGNKDEALKVYEKVQKDFADTEYARLANSYVLSLQTGSAATN